MANTFFGLTIGASGLTASNIAVNTVAHNISNINTAGYTKQSTNMEASFGIQVYQSYGTVGTGVTVSSIEQARSEYYDNRYWNNNAQYGQYSTLNTYSTLIEDYLDEFSMDGFITEYNNLFGAINELTSDPSSEVARTQFLSYASSICEYFNTLSTNLKNVQNDLNTEVKSSVDTVNTIAAQIAALNKQINIIEVNGGEANDLRDSRNLLIDELSTYANTRVSETEIGNGATEYIVYINNQTLVSGYNYNQLLCVPRETSDKRNASDSEGLYDIEWSNGLPFNPYDSSLKGSLKALMDLRDGCNNAYEKVTSDDEGNQQLEVVADTYRNSSHKGIPYYQSQLNDFLTAFAEEFNSIITNGQTADGADCITELFVSKYGDDYVSASNIGVNEVFINDLDMLPVSYDVSKGAENSDMAKDLYALKDKVTIKSGTFWDYLTSIVSEIGVDSSRATTFQKNYANIKKTIDNQRMSVSGVDEDEEGVDLVKYQNSYNLASKVISVMNEIYSKLIEETGL